MKEKEKIKVLVINPIMGPYVRIISDELQSYYNIIDCDCIDITTRKIGNKYYDIIVDDEGLLKDDFIVSAIDSNYKPALVGNLVITNFDEEGNTTTLTDEDIRYIKQFIGHYSKPDTNVLAYTVLTQVDF